MKKTSKRIFILFIFSIFFLSTSSRMVVQAQEITADPQVTPTSNVSEMQSSSKEVQILQAQLETMRFYDQKIISTVYWALGSIFGVIILIASYGWFSNFQIYKKDVARLEKTIDEKINNSNLIINAELKKIENELYKNFNANKDKIQAEITTSLKSEFNSLFENINNDIKNLHYEIKCKKIEIIELEAKYWEIEEVEINAIFCYIQAINLKKELKSNSGFDRYLGKILELLDKINTFDTYLNTDLEKSMMSLPPEYTSIIESIHTKVKKIIG